MGGSNFSLSLGSSLLEGLGGVRQVRGSGGWSFRFVVLDSGFDGVFGEKRAVKLDGWEAQFVGNLCVLNLSGFLH